MIKKCILALLFYVGAHAKTIRVAIIDTGLTNSKGLPMCDTGHKSFVSPTLTDTMGHGTNVAHLIHRYAKGADYCMIILKFYPTKSPMLSSIAAFKHILKLKNVDIINYSAGGKGGSVQEQNLLRKIIQSGITVVAAAGNGTKTQRARTSNYGWPVDLWRNGEKQTAGGYTFSGSSQATAIATGQIIKWADKKRKTSSIDTKRAIKKALEAFYKQSRLNVLVNKKLKKYEQSIPETIKRPIKFLLPVGDLLIKKQFKYEWTF